jgi:hypothetical protein
MAEHLHLERGVAGVVGESEGRERMGSRPAPVTPRQEPDAGQE